MSNDGSKDALWQQATCKKDEYIYKDSKNKYEQFVECFYQSNRNKTDGKGRQNLIREAQVIINTRYL